MHIINAFLKFTRLSSRRARTCFSNETDNESYEEVPDSEATCRDADHGVTSQYNEFTHSWDAFWMCFGHGFCYYGASILGYSYLFEKWPLEDSVYFATVVFTTVGYGDLHPTNVHSQVFTMGLVIYGIIILGIFIGILGDIIVEGHNATVQSRLKTAHSEVLEYLAQQHGETTVNQSTNASTADGLVMEEGRTTRLLSSYDSGNQPAETSLLRDVLSVIVLEAPIVFLVVVLGILLGTIEGWSTLESVYFVVITGTTVGLGDVTPHTTTVRMWSVVFLPLTVAVLGELLARIAATYMNRKRRKVDKEFLSHPLTLCDIQTMDGNRDGTVDRAEFIIYMLLALQRVDKDDIDDVNRCFDRLDRTNTGSLTINDLTNTGWNENFRQKYRQTVAGPGSSSIDTSVNASRTHQDFRNSI